MEPAADPVTAAFERFVGDIDYPLFIVTTRSAAGERSGCLVGFATQTSINPPRFLVGLSVTNHTFGVAQDATHLALHAVGRKNKDLARLFGGESGDDIDKFTRVAWHDGPAGAPILDELQSWFVGRIVERIDFGDHVGHLLEPVAAQGAPVDNLQFGDARDIDPGHDP